MLGIISINRYSKHLNYGAALHSFAFQHLLDKYGIDNEIIDFIPRFMKGYRLKWPALTKQPRDQMRRSAAWTLGAAHNRIKFAKFAAFFEEQYRMSNVSYDAHLLNYAELPYSQIACANDVIWSPHTTLGFEPAFFGSARSMLTIPTFSYAASIGNYNFSNQQRLEFTRLLRRVDPIGVREYPAQEFVEQFTDRPVTTTLDSTLLLRSDDYQSIAVEPKEDGYVLIYNCLKNNRKMIDTAQTYAEHHGLKVIEVSNYTQNKFDHKTLTAAGVEEFLGLFSGASFVFTNAFHGLCFSLIFGKPFLVFSRGTKDSRVTSLLERLGASEAFVPEDAERILPVEIDWDRVRPALEHERHLSMEFLSRALQLEELRPSMDNPSNRA